MNISSEASTKNDVKGAMVTVDASGVNSVMVNVIIGHSNQIADHYSGRRNLDLEEIRHA